ncbi:hypothetical protein MLP_14860 [Microlunatus phosphovorus NM-1]|uniref:DNA-binding protein n=1 Tax=Microlunatus phosphovorus (strain ATCC 700054 / DSM 10555 / JCM 9379 / NBRC 101784 / NCIMB 13414 / VKM Ac-1990 / NM-1) TaxID=1032480 RepID=F5XQK0_MICPN|nr:SatD family protein [Microlunatus phosphovorus]BAK34500.1 hypothetical protein MLP_14860 [Microlunatus phosphovorus NM-1]
MPYVMTVDQISSRQRRDAVPAAITAMATRFPHAKTTRTVGDEFQALFVADPMSVVDAILMLMREGSWHVGIGIGPVEEPVPDDLRAARGPAFLAARQAVEEAKERSNHLQLVATPPAAEEGVDAEVLLELLLTLRARRSDAGWAAAELADAGLTQAAIGTELGISRQAVNQRLQAAQWALDARSRPVAARLLARTEQITTGGIAP